MILRGALLASIALLAACASTREPSIPSGSPHYKIGDPYRINGKTYYPREEPDYEAVGTASWYGDAFDGKRTANGEIFDKNRLSAAHTTMPLPSLVEVENVENGRRVVVRVNDRGPFVDDRLIDLSHAAARALDFERAGLAKVRVRYLGRAELAALAPAYGSDRGTRIASGASPPPPVSVSSPSNAGPAVLAMAPVDSATAGAPLVAPTPAAEGSAFETAPLEPIPGTRIRGEAGVPVQGPTAGPPGQIEALIEDAVQTTPTRTEYWITVAQFFGLSELEGAMTNLSSFGSVRMVSDAGGVGYRLQMGPYPDEASANASLAVLREAGYVDALIAGESCYASPAESNLASC